MGEEEKSMIEDVSKWPWTDRPETADEEFTNTDAVVLVSVLCLLGIAVIVMDATRSATNRWERLWK